MKTITKKVTIEEFIGAYLTAQQVINKLHPRTRLAYWCGEFMNMNKKTYKALQKQQKERTLELNREVDRVAVENALCNKETGALLAGKNGEYQYDNKGELALKEKQWEIAPKLDPIIEEFMAGTTEVKCLDGTIELPPNVQWETDNALNGFAYNNVSEFHEPIEETHE